MSASRSGGLVGLGGLHRSTRPSDFDDGLSHNPTSFPWLDRARTTARTQEAIRLGVDAIEI